MPPPAVRDKAVPQLPVPVVQYDSIIPETEADATFDEQLFRERRTKSRNDPQWQERLPCGDEEVNGRLKRRKGHQRTDSAGREVHINLQEGDGSQKWKVNGSISRRTTQLGTASDFQRDTVSFSSDDDDESEDSEDDFQNMPTMSQLAFGTKESHIDRFLRGLPDKDDRKTSATNKREETAPCYSIARFNKDQIFSADKDLEIPIVTLPYFCGPYVDLSCPQGTTSTPTQFSSHSLSFVDPLSFVVVVVVRVVVFFILSFF